MIVNPMLSGGNSVKKFIYNDTLDTSATLNGEPIESGETVELEVGSINYLYSSYSNYSSRLVTDSGISVPLSASPIEPSTTRAGDPKMYICFVMPNENANYYKTY